MVVAGGFEVQADQQRQRVPATTNTQNHTKIHEGRMLEAAMVVHSPKTDPRLVQTEDKSDSSQQCLGRLDQLLLGCSM